jgi:hypothetical protein
LLCEGLQELVHTAARKALCCTLVAWGVDRVYSTLSRLALISR